MFTVTAVSCYIPTSTANNSYRELFAVPQLPLRPREFKELLAGDPPAPMREIWTTNPGWPAFMSGILHHPRAEAKNGLEGLSLFPSPPQYPEPFSSSVKPDTVQSPNCDLGGGCAP